MSNTPSENTGAPNVYGRNWDKYVRENFPRHKARQPELAWPGDEWGTEASWTRLFEMMIGSKLPADAKKFIEIGPGSGKYTLLTIEHFKSATVLACDVSAAYLDVLKDRCADEIEAGRVRPHFMTPSATALASAATALWGSDPQVDAVISIDAMVHVDIHYITSYCREAAKLLRPGGKVVMTVADATSEGGVNKLIKDIDIYFRDAEMLGKFEFISPDIVTAVLNKLGFEVELFRFHRDLGFVATKVA